MDDVMRQMDLEKDMLTSLVEGHRAPNNFLEAEIALEGGTNRA